MPKERGSSYQHNKVPFSGALPRASRPPQDSSTAYRLTLWPLNRGLNASAFLPIVCPAEREVEKIILSFSTFLNNSADVVICQSEILEHDSTQNCLVSIHMDKGGLRAQFLLTLPLFVLRAKWDKSGPSVELRCARIPE